MIWEYHYFWKHPYIIFFCKEIVHHPPRRADGARPALNSCPGLKQQTTQCVAGKSGGASIYTWNLMAICLQMVVSIGWWTKSLHEKWLFQQTSIKSWLFRVPGIYIYIHTYAHTYVHQIDSRLDMVSSSWQCALGTDVHIYVRIYAEETVWCEEELQGRNCWMKISPVEVNCEKMAPFLGGHLLGRESATIAQNLGIMIGHHGNPFTNQPV